MPFHLIRQDITKLKVDAIVNAANTQLKMGGGVCGAIYHAAGAEQLTEETDRLGPIETGEAVITLGYNLPAKMIIHTAGPIYHDGLQNESELLKNAYLNSLKLAAKHNLDSIAFPLLSSGIYGYPKNEAFEIAKETILDFLEEHEMDVYLVLYDKESFRVPNLLKLQIDSFMDDFDVKLSARYLDVSLNRQVLEEHDYFKLDESFNDTLFRLIDDTGLSDVEVYKRSNLDRKLFSKIRNKDYVPSKKTIVALAIGLRLSEKQTQDLLAKAGYTLSMSQQFDAIILYFLRKRSYDIFKINEVLFDYDQVTLG